jgi:3-phenylpropionate/trans-cinnamate dioxygenase ferredoxin subunit
MPTTIQRLCAAADVEPLGGARRHVGRHRIALVRIGDDFYAVGDKCSHADFSLSEGEVWSEEREIECWKHGSTFSLVDGCPQSLPATTAIPVYKVHVEGGHVVVEVPK